MTHHWGQMFKLSRQMTRRTFGEPALRRALYVVGDEGLDSLSEPATSSLKTSFQEKIALQHATGMRHPDPFGVGCLSPYTNQKAYLSVDSLIGG